MAAPNGRGHRMTQRGQEAAQRCLWQMQQAAFKAAPRLAGTNVAAGRLVQRGPLPSRPQHFSFGPLSAPVSASWLGSLAAPSAATRTRAPKRATGTFFSLRSCPVRASARVTPKRNTILSDGVSFWSGRRGSNSLPRPWQGRALPDELRPQNGASGRGRTGDTRIFSPLLYQLSYRGKWRPRRGSNPRPPA